METFSQVFSSNAVYFVKEAVSHNIPLHSLIMYRNNRIESEMYFSPVKSTDLQRVFSISKPLTALGIGLLVEEGRLSLTDSICDYFHEYVSRTTHPTHLWLKECTIEDMLMMKGCHLKSTYDKFDMTSDWVESYFTTMPTKEPGTSFDYDTSASHVLCALVEKITGMPLLDYIRNRLPDLGLSKEAYMLKDKKGFSMGGTGLMCTSRDMLALGIMLLKCNRKGEEPDYLSPFMVEYIKSACTKHSETSHIAKSPFESFGFGYHIWMADHEGFVCYGMGGQFIMVHPKDNLVFVTTADTQAMNHGNQLIFDCFHKNILLKQDDTKTIEFDVPEIATVNGDNRPINFSCDAFEIKNGKLDIRLSEKLFSFNFGYKKNSTGTINHYNMKYCASGAWIDEKTFYIRANILDTSLGWLEFMINFGESVSLKCNKHEETLFMEFDNVELVAKI